MTTPVPSPRRFFREFVKAFIRECRQDSSDLRESIRRQKERMLIGHRYIDDFEWTAMMGLFLSRLACSRRFGLRQEWEFRRVDYVWYDGLISKVLIEHEQQRYQELSHVDKLRRVASEVVDEGNPAPLSVAITYEWIRKRKPPVNFDEEKLVSMYQDRLRMRRAMTRPFLLVIGWSDGWRDTTMDPFPWAGYQWNQVKGELRKCGSSPDWTHR